MQIGGLGALENAAGIDAELAKAVRNAGSVAREATGLGGFPQKIDRGQPVERGQLGQLHPPSVEKRASPDEDGIELLSGDVREGEVDLACGVGIEEANLQPDCGRSRLHVTQGGRGIGDIGRIGEDGNASCARRKLAQQLQPLGRQLGIEQINPGQIAARTGKTGNEAKPHGVFRSQEDNGDRRGRGLGHLRSMNPSRSDDHRDPSAN